MADIDIGSAAILRSGTMSYGYTILDDNNPANATGILTMVQMYCIEITTGIWVGTFYNTGGNTYKCRDSVYIATSPIGVGTHTELSIEVQTGDIIGIYYPSGRISQDAAGGVRNLRLEGNYASPGAEGTYTAQSSRVLSLYGEGQLPPAVYSFTIDAILQKTQASSFTADSYLTYTFTIDAVLQGEQTDSLIADAVLKEAQTDSFTADAYLSEIFTVDAVLKGTQSSSITAGAVLKGTLSDSFTANGVLLKTTTDTIAADAILKGTLADSFTADACLISDAVSPKQYLFTKAGLVYLPIFPLQPVSVSVSANHTADYRSIIFCDATSGSFTVTLPDAADNLDKVYTIKHTSGSHSVVVQGAETIDNAASQTLNEYDVLRIISDNSEWWTI